MRNSECYRKSEVMGVKGGGITTSVVVKITAIVVIVAVAGIGFYFMLIKPWIEEKGLGFTISVSPDSGSVARGESTSATVSVSSIAGFAETVGLSASGLPSVATASFSPSSGTPSFTSTLTISTSPATPAGTYSITITGTGEGLTHITIYTLTVTTGVTPGIYTSRDPIYIPLDDQFTPANGVVNGSGTQADPYIIEGWAIDASETIGICIWNTTAYFIIRNCLVENGGYGVYGERNVGIGVWGSNGRIENNICLNNRYGIEVYGSNNTISNNTCSNNGWGIFGDFVENSILTNNICENNEHGISFANSENVTISNNICSNNFHGIEVWWSSNNTLSGNTCSNNSEEGICLQESSYNILTNNTCSNNGWYGIYISSGSSNNTLTGNTLLNNPYVDEGTNNIWA